MLARNSAIVLLVATLCTTIWSSPGAAHPPPQARVSESTDARLAKLEERAKDADKRATGPAKDLATAQADLRRDRDDISWLDRSRPPIGSILPFIGDPGSLTDEWQLCNGDSLKAPK